MKLPLHSLLPILMASPLSVDAYSTSLPTFVSSRYTSHPGGNTRTNNSYNAYSSWNHRRRTALKYTNSNDLPKNDNEGEDTSSGGSANVWTVLANTERWISDTLDRSNRAANEMKQRKDGGSTFPSADASSSSSSPSASTASSSSSSAYYMSPKNDNKKDNSSSSPSSSSSSSPKSPSSGDNPYSRKEVSYVCETGSELTAVVAGIFQRVRQAREVGEGHGRRVGEQLDKMGDSSYTPTTMRQTNVVVIPNCEEISEFHVFDDLVQAINQARRKARDFVIKKSSSVEGEDEDKAKDWVVSINCAHLHPQYGIETPQEIMQAMKDEDEAGEVDVNHQEYKKRRDEARRSPYPSVIVEVQSTPPPDFGSSPPPKMMESTKESSSSEPVRMGNGDSDDSVTSEDVKRLEALFSMSAAKKSKTEDFYDALGEAFGDKQLSAQTPLEMAQNWILHNDPAFDEKTSTFTNSDTRHVDAAYEFVFNNLAMMLYEPDPQPTDSAAATTDKPTTSKRGQKSYVVLPNFLPTSATSFDRFAGQVSNIIRVMPSVANKVMVSTFHPEHVDEGTRSPAPIFVFTWK